jgi:hypothetical protein
VPADRPGDAAAERVRYLLDGAELVPTPEGDGPSYAAGAPASFLRNRVGGWKPLADALGTKTDSISKVLRGGRDPWRRCSSTWV